MALLPMGGLFSAVRMPEYLLTALSGGAETACVDDFLAEALGGGPVICDPRFSRYYALVPADVPTTPHRMADTWHALGVSCLGRGSHLGVPRLDAVDSRRPSASYWSVPLNSAAMLCTPLMVARLIAAGRSCVDTEPEA
ncbi:hypothetical protein AB0K53_02940 [Streptomyces tuirus]|uniref:hypothetical protein n=1 Tax=Streptomyces tuirus TaxID=68278 RepID=UPI003420D313